MCIINNILKRLHRLYYKLNPYKSPDFPYDMRKAIEYAASVGKRVFELSSQEMEMFLLK